jgi:hypothetical protein
MSNPTLAGGLALALAAALATAAHAAPAPPGHDLMLRQLIQDAANGAIRYQTLTPELGALVKPQAGLAQSQLVSLGALKSITLTSTTKAGAEIYRTVFEKGALDWAFSVNAQGLIDNAAYRPVTPDPS